MQAVVVGLNINKAPVEILEALSIHHSDINARLKELPSFAKVQGAVILSTCNRLEFYAVTEDPLLSTELLKAFLCQPKTSSLSSMVDSFEQQRFSDKAPLHSEFSDRKARTYVYAYSGADAVRHLYHVVSGLDSLILGETEIRGQVARAYETARKAGSTNKLLNVWFQRALSVGKLVRTQFGMDKHHTSIGRIAVDLAEQTLGSFDGKQILILGAGEMCELTMKHLLPKANSLVMVSNRSMPKAQQLAQDYGFEARPLSELADNLKEADLVFSATSFKNYLVPYSLYKDIHAQRKGKPLVFIDMAVPRDIDPRLAELSEVQLFDIKQLRDVSDKNLAERERAAKVVALLLDEKVADFIAWHETPLQVKIA